MSKRVHPLRSLPHWHQRAIRRRIETLEPHLQFGMSAAALIRALWADTVIMVHHANKTKSRPRNPK